MKKCLLAISLILGTVIGSGFSTGKEIAVFFSRFGYYSFLFIPLSAVLFYFAFYFLMYKGREKLQSQRNSKLVLVLMLVSASVFSASMFAGIGNCANDVSKVLKYILLFSVLLLCFFACFKKLEFLSKVNLILIPILLAIILIFFIFAFPKSSFVGFPKQGFLVEFFGGAFYTVLYIVLNLSLSSIVIADTGRNLTKKQIKCASLISAIILSVFMFLINLLIVCNYDYSNFS